MGGGGGVEFDLFDDGGTDDDAVGGLGDEGGLFGVGDAEADADGGVGVLFDGGDLCGDGFGGCGVAAGDARAGKGVDEALGLLGEEFDAFGRGGWRDEADVGESLEFGEFFGEGCFVRGEVEEEDAVGPGGDGVGLEFSKAVGEDGVEVGEEDDGGGGVCLAEVADEVESAGGCHAGFEGAVGGHLVDDAVGEGIGKGEAEFDDMGTDVGEGVHDFEGEIEARITGGDVCDEGFLIF